MLNNIARTPRNRYKAFADTKPISMTIEEHQAAAQKLRWIASELRGVRDLLGRRYPDVARCRQLAVTADADVAALRVAMAGVAHTEVPASGIDYTANT